MWPRPGWTSSTRRSPRSSEIADENVRSGTTTSVAATSAQRGSSSSAARGPYLGGVLRGGSRRRSRGRSARLPRPGARRCRRCGPSASWLLTAHSTGRLLTRRRSATTSRASAADAWVSRTSSPASPATTETLTSSHGYRATHTRSATSLKPATRASLVRLALTADECQDGRRGRRADCRTTASSPSCEPSSRTTSPPRSRSAPRPWSSVTPSVSRPRRSATTWRRWRRRGSSPSRTPAPAGSPPTRATGCSSTA